mgnify:CR=1 FL=1
MKRTLKQSLLSAVTLGLLLGTATSSTAQQLPLFNEYSENAYILNPGMTGWDDVTAITATYRHQWTGMDDAPRTLSLGYRQNISKANMGVGAYVWRDQAGPTTFMGGSVSGAYHIQLANEKNGNSTRNRLAIGLSLSVMQYQLQGDQLQFNDPNDPLATAVNRSKILPDAGAGIFYYNDNVYVGFSAPQLLRMKVNLETDGGIANLQREPHFYVSSGVKLQDDPDNPAQNKDFDPILSVGREIGLID